MVEGSVDMSGCSGGGSVGGDDGNNNNGDDAGPSGNTHHQAYILEPEAILDHCVNQVRIWSLTIHQP